MIFWRRKKRNPFDSLDDVILMYILYLADSLYKNVPSIRLVCRRFASLHGRRTLGDVYAMFRYTCARDSILRTISYVKDEGLQRRSIEDYHLLQHPNLGRYVRANGRLAVYSLFRCGFWEALLIGKKNAIKEDDAIVYDHIFQFHLDLIRSDHFSDSFNKKCRVLDAKFSEDRVLICKYRATACLEVLLNLCEQIKCIFPWNSPFDNKAVNELYDLILEIGRIDLLELVCKLFWQYAIQQYLYKKFIQCDDDDIFIFGYRKASSRSTFRELVLSGESDVLPHRKFMISHCTLPYDSRLISADYREYIAEHGTPDHLESIMKFCLWDFKLFRIAAELSQNCYERIVEIYSLNRESSTECMRRHLSMGSLEWHRKTKEREERRYKLINCCFHSLSILAVVVIGGAGFTANMENITPIQGPIYWFIIFSYVLACIILSMPMITFVFDLYDRTWCKDTIFPL